MTSVPPTTRSPRPASFFRRALAFIIDELLVGMVSAGGLYLFVFHRSPAAAIGLTLLAAAYKPVMEARYGWTLGKISQRLRVIDRVSGRRPDLNQALMRYLPWALGIFATIFTIVRHFQDPDFAAVTDLYEYLEFTRNSPLSESWVIQMLRNVPIFSAAWIIADPIRQALHDKLAGTVVITIE